MTTNVSIISFSLDESLTNMISQTLDCENKEMFITNFQLYLMYGNDLTKFVVDLDIIWEWLGFTRIDNVKRLLSRNFSENEDYKVLLLREDKPLGGRPKEKIMMNVETFKALCMMSNTPKGKQTRRYYSKMESIFFKYIEDKHQTTLQALETEKKKIECDLKRQKEVDIQAKLIEKHKNTPLVYILKVQEADDHNFIIKIGETDDINQRVISHRQEYNECVLIDVFPCARPHAFEQFILKHKQISEHRVTATETIRISPKFSYDALIKIIKKNINNFNGLSPTERLEIEKIKYRTKLLETIQGSTDDFVKKQLIDLLSKETFVHETTESESDDEEICKFRQRCVYQYDPSDLTKPINVFNSLRQAARSLKNAQFHDYHIRNASNKNTIFANFRWYYTDGEDVSLPSTLPLTQEDNEPSRNTGLIAQVDKDKTHIINVFASQRDAEKETNVHNCQISMGVTTGTLKNGYYWMMYDTCTDDLKQSFKGSLPEPKRMMTCSKNVQRIDPITNKVLETYHCIQDICNQYKCCHKSINKASKSGDVFKGYKWNIVAV
jgi:phage anti-repressor protein|uniref:MSV199 domain-containing protein n=1 Tax=viral metagenome TaxID=1070528 RepID=A0A6C0BGR4_9ZZZZ